MPVPPLVRTALVWGMFMVRPRSALGLLLLAAGSSCWAAAGLARGLPSSPPATCRRLLSLSTQLCHLRLIAVLLNTPTSPLTRHRCRACHPTRATSWCLGWSGWWTRWVLAEGGAAAGAAWAELIRCRLGRALDWPCSLRGLRAAAAGVPRPAPAHPPTYPFT